LILVNIFDILPIDKGGTAAKLRLRKEVKMALFSMEQLRNVVGERFDQAIAVSANGDRILSAAEVDEVLVFGGLDAYRVYPTSRFISESEKILLIPHLRDIAVWSRGFEMAFLLTFIRQSGVDQWLLSLVSPDTREKKILVTHERFCPTSIQQ
jgi:hypothetical protein